MKLSRIFLPVFISIMVAGCTSPIAKIPFSAVKNAVEFAAEDRSSDHIVDDTTIKAKILTDIVTELGSDILFINADVYEDNVMLTGAVEKTSVRNKAVQLAKKTEGVKKVYNDILVITPKNRKKGHMEEYVEDFVIETKIYAQLLQEKNINSVNFRWRAVGGRVFLFGRALSRNERAKTIKVIKEIEGVKSIKHHVFIRPEQPKKDQKEIKTASTN